MGVGPYMATKSTNKTNVGQSVSTLPGAKVGSYSGTEQLTKALTFAVKNAKKEGFRVELGEDNNLYKWQVHLFDFPATSNLAYVLPVVPFSWPQVFARPQQLLDAEDSAGRPFWPRRNCQEFCKHVCCAVA